MARAVVAAESTTRRAGPSCRRDRAGQQRKVRAAEHHGVDARIEMREVALGDRVDRLALAPALFGQRHEDLAGHLRDVRVGTQRVDGALIGAALHRAFGGEHRDAAAGGLASQAARAPGSITPMTGSVGKSLAQAGSAVADAVLQATTSALMPRATSASAARTE